MAFVLGRHQYARQETGCSNKSAGSGGDRRAVIRALHLDSDQVCIADVRAPGRLSMQEATLVVCSPKGKLSLKPQHAASPGSLEATLGSFEGHRDVSRLQDEAAQVHFWSVPNVCKRQTGGAGSEMAERCLQTSCFPVPA